MNRAFKDLCLFSLGAGIGSLVTFFTVKGIYEAKADKEVESVKEAYNRKAEAFGVLSSVGGEIKGPSEINDKPVEMVKSTSSIAQKMNNKPPLKDYTKFFENPEESSEEAVSPPEDEPYTDEEDKLQTMECIDSQLNGDHRKALAEDIGPRVIDRSEYELSCEHYDKIALIYYISDDILCEDTGEEVDRHRLIGDLIEKSGFDQNEDEELLVRNDKLTSDFEITKIYTKYEGMES